MKEFKKLLALLLVFVMIFSMSLTGLSAVAAQTQDGDAKELVVYVPNWRDVKVSQLPWDRLTYINHAFWEIYPDGDGGFPIRSTESAADAVLFEDYAKYAPLYPDVNVVISVGGWTRCGYFSEMAYTQAGRASFIQSCIDTLNQYPWLGGIDIDWEYPGVARSSDGAGDQGCPVYGTPAEDKENYNALLKEMREAFDQEFGAGEKVITVCSAAGTGTIARQDVAEFTKYVDLVNIMCYDFASGSWGGTTWHQSSLYAPSDQHSVEAAVNAFLDAGVDPSKLNVGSPLYAHAWSGVDTSNVEVDTDILGRKGSTSSYDSMYWRAIKGLELTAVPIGESGWHMGYDEDCEASFLWNDELGEYLSYDNERALQAKIDYVNEKGLGGLIIWESTGDSDTDDYPMITQMAIGLGIYTGKQTVFGSNAGVNIPYHPAADFDFDLPDPTNEVLLGDGSKTFAAGEYIFYNNAIWLALKKSDDWKDNMPDGQWGGSLWKKVADVNEYISQEDNGGELAFVTDGNQLVFYATDELTGYLYSPIGSGKDNSPENAPTGEKTSNENWTYKATLNLVNPFYSPKYADGAMISVLEADPMFYGEWTAEPDVTPGLTDFYPAGSIVSYDGSYYEAYKKADMWTGWEPDAHTNWQKITILPEESENGPTSVALTSSYTYVHLGSTLKINAVVLPLGCDDSIEWSSSDESIATVDENGVVTPVSSGSVKISAVSTVNSLKGSISLYVPKYSLDEDNSLEDIYADELFLDIWKSRNFVYNGVEYEDNYPAGSIVIYQGKFYEAYGTPSIWDNGWEPNVHSLWTEIPVANPNNELLQITLPFATKTVAVGDEIAIKASIYPHNAETAITWESSDTNVATVDQDGNVSIISKGAATITVSTDNGKSASAIVYAPKYADATLENTLLDDPLFFGEFQTDAFEWNGEEMNTYPAGSIVTYQDNYYEAYVPSSAWAQGWEPDRHPNWHLVTTREYIQLESILVTGDTLFNLRGEATAAWTLTPVPANADTVYEAVWKSQNEDVATVDENGVVTAVGVGETAIEVAYGTHGFVAPIKVIDEDGIPDAIILASTENIELDIASEKTYEIETPSVTTSNKAPFTGTLSWSSSDESVATVDENGLVTAVGEGEALIKVFIEGTDISAGINFVVVDNSAPHIVDFIASPDELTLDLNDETDQAFIITAKAIMSDGSEVLCEDILISSSDENIVIVDEYGVVAAVSEGEAVITVSLPDTDFTDEVNVTVVDTSTTNEPSLTVEDSEITIDLAEANYADIKPIAKLADGSPYLGNFYWSSSDDKIATVSGGRVTALSVGEVIITISIPDTDLKCDVTITIIDSTDPVTGIKVDPDEVKLVFPDDTDAQITAEVSTKSGEKYTGKVVWTSTDIKVATVDSNGKITAVGEGKTTVTASIPGTDLIAEVKVTVEGNPVIAKSAIRLAGKSRVQTAVAIALEDRKSAETVLIATGKNFADALAGGPLAYALDAPILLTMNGADIEPEILSAIKELKVKNVVYLGGENAVQNYDSKFAGLDIYRVSGGTRYQTAIKIAERLADTTGKTPTQAFLASGTNFPDALAISPVASLLGAPIIFTYGGEHASLSETLDADTADYIKEISLKDITVVGGEKAVTAATANAVNKITGEKADRVFGTSRYLTSVEIYKAYKDIFNSDDKGVALATGTTFPDALVGGVFAAQKGMPLILVYNADPKNEASYKDLCAALKDIDAATVYLFGGEAAVSEKTLKDYVDVTDFDLTRLSMAE